VSAAPPPRPARPDDTDSAPAEPESLGTLALRLALFVAFAAFGVLHWTLLVADPPAGIVAATVGAATACAVALTALDRSALPRAAVEALAALAVIASLAAGMVACGVEPRLLLPSGWGELADRIDQALLAVQTVDWPYSGPDDWVGTTILLGIPPLLTSAAALAFWPAAPPARQPLRLAALIALIAIYAIAVTTSDPGSPVLLGALLLTLIAAWLWLPRRRGRELAIGATTILAAGLLALPPALALDRGDAWFDYRSWSLFGPRSGVAFSWDHGYGPLDWPRQGTTLLSVRSDSPQYWKAQALGDFDGVRWLRTRGYEPRPLDAELPFDGGDASADGRWDYGEPNPRWTRQARFEVRSLSTELLVGAGLPFDVDGATATTSADGTTQLLGPPLERGDSYTVRFYQPNPTPSQMAGAPTRYPDWADRYTTVAVPESGADPSDTETVVVPPRGDPVPAAERAAAVARLAGSPYRRAHALARQLTADSASAYEAVLAVERHLLANYRYDERVPVRTYPLESFLFDDRIGYCQQFSGAMALMLRMAGIPARVAAGFSPGTREEERGTYRVRDLDAHSWVEVYFAGIGWVTFDPTPRAAEDEATGDVAAAGSSAAGVVRQGGAQPESIPAPPPDERQRAGGGAQASAAGDGSSDGPSATVVAAVAGGAVLVALLGGLAVGLRVRRRRALDADGLASAATGELHRALDRLGWDVSPTTTLLALERRLGEAAGPAAAAYARALRGSRFDSEAAAPPGPEARRALRRDLAARGGPLGRLRALIALPPGGPVG
jgi:transglutaminase-like putative cysteine protease